MTKHARTTRKLTVEEFLVFPTPDGKAELVRGELRLSPPEGPRHGVVWASLTALLHQHVRKAGWGQVLAGSSFELVELSATIRAPDVAFVRRQRLSPSVVAAPTLKIAPDLAAEILSPSETAARLDEKLHDYVASHVPLIWVVDPERRTVRVIASDAPVRWLREGDMLDAGDVVPGFACPVSELFAGID